MLHSSPKPLKVALDLAKKLNSELGKYLTPEQRRDFMRLTKLIDEADRNHVIEITRLHRKAAAAEAQPAAAAPAKRRFLWV